MPAVIPLYRIKLRLKAIWPPIWRRVLLPGDLHLGQVHDCVQIAMGWADVHEHELLVDDVCFGVPDPGDDHAWGPPLRDENWTRLKQIARTPGTQLRYIYDLHQFWEHELRVEWIGLETPAVPLPCCLGGRRACPPEDCGGPRGFQRLCAILGDPQHPEHPKVMEQWGTQILAGPFDLAAANRRLQAAFHPSR